MKVLRLRDKSYFSLQCQTWQTKQSSLRCNYLSEYSHQKYTKFRPMLRKTDSNQWADQSSNHVCSFINRNSLQYILTVCHLPPNHFFLFRQLREQKWLHKRLWTAIHVSTSLPLVARLSLFSLQCLNLFHKRMLMITFFLRFKIISMKCTSTLTLARSSDLYYARARLCISCMFVLCHYDVCKRTPTDKCHFIL